MVLVAARYEYPDFDRLFPTLLYLIVLVFPVVLDAKLNWQGNSVVLYDARRVACVTDALFDETHWRSTGQVVGEAMGRGHRSWRRLRSKAIRHPLPACVSARTVDG